MKKLTSTIMIAAAALCLTACGGKKETAVTIDASALAKDLQSCVTSDSLTETSADMLASIYYYDADSVNSAVAYMSSGATACEIAVVESKEADYTDDVEGLFKTRVKNQSDLYASYNEGEVAKLDDAIIQSAGNYTVLVVCDDAGAAKDVLKKYGMK